MRLKKRVEILERDNDTLSKNMSELSARYGLLEDITRYLLSNYVKEQVDNLVRKVEVDTKPKKQEPKKQTKKGNK